MSNLATITLNGHIDRQANTTTSGDIITVLNEYAPELDAQKLIKLSDFDAPTLEAFFTVFDFITNQFEANALLFKIAYDDETKGFDLTDSFVRDTESTETPTALTAGTPITVRFEIPGFDTIQTVEVTALYGQAFSSEDLAAVAALGITITGTGDDFTVANTVECRAAFFKPVASEDIYVISYPAQGTIIPAESYEP